MTMSDLAARLALAADDLAAMRAEMAAESGFDASGHGTAETANLTAESGYDGRGAAERLAAHLTAAWNARQEALGRLSGSLAELGVNVRVAAQRYGDADSALAAGEVKAEWTL